MAGGGEELDDDREVAGGDEAEAERLVKAAAGTLGMPAARNSLDELQIICRRKDHGSVGLHPDRRLKTVPFRTDPLGEGAHR